MFISSQLLSPCGCREGTRKGMIMLMTLAHF